MLVMSGSNTTMTQTILFVVLRCASQSPHVNVGVTTDSFLVVSVVAVLEHSMLHNLC